MTPDRYREVERAFVELLPLATVARAAALRDLAARDRELHDEVASLLAHADSPSPVDGPAIERAFAREASVLLGAEPDGEEPVPRRIGAYAIVRRIAAGGMGIVYEALQDNPRRRVALKCLRPGMGSREMVRRFAGEAQVLGQLHHPGIAQVYEAGVGAADSGPEEVPYFAMELVLGLPLDAYARQRGLDLRQRLDLLARVCDAVQHAHGRGFIHRDLKPDNVLVDARGEVKVLDFGIAKATRSADVGHTAATHEGQVLGTLAYMSPEQFGGRHDAVDTRSDVYTLGVLTYELLANRKPIEVTGLTVVEAARAVLDREPLRLGSLDRRLGGDVEAIVQRAMEKEPSRRYLSVAELAEDIRRYLRDEAIVARPRSSLYQFRKLARRHRAVFAGSLLAVLALALGLGVAARQAARAERARRAEKTARTHAEEAVHEARLAVYRLSLAAAAAALADGDTALARHHLEAAPGALRGWEWRQFAARLDRSRRVIPRPGFFARRAGFSPDGSYVVLGRGEQAPVPLLRIDVVSGAVGATTFDETSRPLQIAGGEGWLAWHLRFLPYERAAAVRVGGVLAEVRPCDVTSRSNLNGIASDLSVGLVLTPGEATVCALGTGESLVRRVHPDEVAFSAGGRWVAYRDPAREALALTDVVRKRTVARSGLTNLGLRSLMFRRDGGAILAGGNDGMLYIFRVPDLALLGSTRAIPRGHVNWADFSPDGRTVAVAGTDGPVRVWNAQLTRLEALYLGHEAYVATGAFRDDGAMLATTDIAGTTRVWDLRLPTAQMAQAGGDGGYVKCLDISPDGHLLATGTWDGAVRLWDAETLAPRGLVASNAGVERFPDNVLFGDGGGTLVIANRTLSVISLPERNVRGCIADAVHAPWRCGMDTARRRIACTSAGTLFLLDAATLSATATLAGIEGPTAFSRDGGRLAVVEGPGAVSIRTLPDLHTVAVLPHATGLVTSNLAWSPDGRHVAMGGEGGRIEVFDALRGDLEATLEGQAGRVFALAYSPDGRRLASGADDSVVRIWDARDHSDLAQLRGHTDYVAALVWSPDGESLYSGSGDRTIRVWRAR